MLPLDFGKLWMKCFPKPGGNAAGYIKQSIYWTRCPKKIQAKANIHEMYMSGTKEDALKAYKNFVPVYQDKYPEALECLTKDNKALFNFFLSLKPTGFISEPRTRLNRHLLLFG